MIPLVPRLGMIFATTLVVVAGCESRGHATTDSPAGSVSVCQSCYDQITRVRRTHPRTGSTTQVIRTHHCPSCKSDLTIYTEGGVLKAKCAGCVPDGVACDLCISKSPSN